MDERKFVLATPGNGRENLSTNLAELGFFKLNALNLPDAVSQLCRFKLSIFALAIPSLARVGINNNSEYVETLIDNAVSFKVARVGVVSTYPGSFGWWQNKSTADSIVRVVNRENNASFFWEYARFLAGLRDDIK